MNSGFTVFLIAVAIAALIYFGGAGRRVNRGIRALYGLDDAVATAGRKFFKINDQLHKGLAGGVGLCHY